MALLPLNTEQQTTHDETLDGQHPLALLTAKAGCGKSFLTARIILSLAERGVLVTIIAPSHTARSVLEAQITTQCDGDPMWNGNRARIISMTTAAAMGKRPDYSKAPKNYKDTNFVINMDGGRLLENSNKDTDRVLFIEEISMVGKTDLTAILKQWNSLGGKKMSSVFVVGDFRQIKPVNGVSPKAYLGKLYKEGKLKHFKLTENMRSKSDTDIAAYSDAVFADEGLSNIGKRGVIEYSDKAAFEAAFNTTVKSESGVTAIAYKNTTVNNYMMIGAGGQQLGIQADDLVRLHEGITVDYKDDDGKWQKETLANNGDIVKVIDFDIDGGRYIHPLCNAVIPYSMITLDLLHPDPLHAMETGSKYVSLMVPSNITDSSNAGKKGAFALLFGELLNKATLAAEDLSNGDDTSENVEAFIFGLDRFDDGVGRIFYNYDNNIQDTKYRNKRKAALIFGRCFFGERSKFVNITKMDSLTAHKSQGQSINKVFADLRDIACSVSEEKLNLAYVVCSRAIKELHVLR